MAFIVKKKINGNEYYYLNENKRIDGKVKTKTLAYLGKDRKDAEEKMKEILNSKNKFKKEKTLKEKMDTKETKDFTMEDMSNFCKRKGFVYQSAEIYGGLAGFWDFGHLGVELKNNVKQNWWNFFVRQREDVVGIDGSIITNPKVWEASGHVEGFNDVLVVCKKCKKTDKIDKHEIKKVKCNYCEGEIDWSKTKEIDQMFKTNVGIEGTTYLRPETAQLIFTNFKLVQDNARLSLPFGIAQIGKAFRNEIAPRDFLFRLREFEQMELEYFVDPNEKFPYKIGNTSTLIYSEEMQKNNQEPSKIKFKEAYKKGIIKTDWHAYWLEQELLWFASLGANPKKFRVRQHTSEEKSHYALDTWDLEYNFPFGWKELQGMANRSDFDLKQHQKYSKTNLEIMNSKGEKILPYVICEPSQGVERAFLVFMFDAYTYDSKRNNVVLKLHPKLAPVKAAIFPIVKKPEFEKIAKNIFDDLKKEFNVAYDKSGSIGKRYARNDEIGTPYCITIDGDSLENKDVTIRERDTVKQIRVKISDLKIILNNLIKEEIKFENAGKKI
jgi:glycyl-tRNA synthetase